MFYKVENEVLIPAPEKGIKVFIANPTAEQYALVGYTDKIVEDEIPEEVEGKSLKAIMNRKTVLYTNDTVTTKCRKKTKKSFKGRVV